MPAHHLLGQFKQYQTHFAIVVDEYGTTAGIVSLRDLLDRIAGEMRDKSEAEPQQIQWLPDGSALVDGLVLLSDVAEELRIPLSDPDYDTLGGFLFGRLGRRPVVGDSVEVAGQVFVIEEIDGLRIARVRVGPVAEGGGKERGEGSPKSPRRNHGTTSGVLWLSGIAEGLQSDGFDLIAQADKLELVASALGA